MAVDSRRKRFSMMSLGDVLQETILTPDGNIGQEDRQHLLWGYYGISWSSAGYIAITSNTIAEYNSMTMTANDYNSMTLEAEDYIEQTLTIEDSV